VASDLPAQYQQQERWRRWDEALGRVPWKTGQRVLDLGCGVGPVTARLHRLGVDAVGVDADSELLAAARARHPDIRFERLDVCALTPATFGPVDGIWASFVAAYFHDLDAVLASWAACVVPGGWLALVEVDDLLGHEPLAPALRDDVVAFYASARAAKGYDFECGRRLAGCARGAGLTVLVEESLPDDELSFDGAAAPDVLEAWRARFRRMAGPRAFLGQRWSETEAGLLAALASPAHRSTCRVVLVVAERPRSP
jgi:SAM-dependent methyltransferase